MVMSKNDYKILIILYKNKCTTEFLSYTIRELSTESNLSLEKVRMSIKKFIDVGYVCEGLLNHQAKTYYITLSGMQKIKEIIKEGVSL